MTSEETQAMRGMNRKLEVRLPDREEALFEEGHESCKIRRATSRGVWWNRGFIPIAEAKPTEYYIGNQCRKVFCECQVRPKHRRR